MPIDTSVKGIFTYFTGDSGQSVLSSPCYTTLHPDSQTCGAQIAWQAGSGTALSAALGKNTWTRRHQRTLRVIVPSPDLE